MACNTKNNYNLQNKGNIDIQLSKISKLTQNVESKGPLLCLYQPFVCDETVHTLL